MPSFCNLQFEVRRMLLKAVRMAWCIPFDSHALCYWMLSHVAFIHSLTDGNLECSQFFPSPKPWCMWSCTLQVPVCLRKKYQAADLPEHRGKRSFIFLPVLRSWAQSKDSGVRLIAFNPATDPHELNDLAPGAKPLSACFLTGKRPVIVGTRVLGGSGGCITIYAQHLEECQAQSPCWH